MIVAMAWDLYCCLLLFFGQICQVSESIWKFRIFFHLNFGKTILQSDKLCIQNMKWVLDIAWKQRLCYLWILKGNISLKDPTACIDSEDLDTCWKQSEVHISQEVQIFTTVVHCEAQHWNWDYFSNCAFAVQACTWFQIFIAGFAELAKFQIQSRPRSYLGRYMSFFKEFWEPQMHS